MKDQIQTKRCGHLGGKKRLGSDIVIVARTDALQSHGVDDAGHRLQVAVAVGADVVFLEGITNEQEARDACKQLSPTRVLLNMVIHGATPTWTPQQAKDFGFKIIIFPFVSIGPAYAAIRDGFLRIKENGKTGLGEDFTPKKLFSLVGLKEAMGIDAAAGGRSYLGV